MKERRELQELMIAALYGEADEEERHVVENAVRQDRHLAAEYEGLKRTLGLASAALPVEDPGPAFWAGVWPRLERRFGARGGGEAGEGVSVLSFRWRWRTALQLVSIAAMLILGVLIGRLITEQEMGTRDARATEPAAAVSFPFESEIEAKKQEYIFDQTKESIVRTTGVLEDFLEINPGVWEVNKADLDRNRERSSELLPEILAMRSRLKDTGFADISNVLDEVELFVGEIANIEGDAEDLWFEVQELQRSIVESRLLNRLQQVRSSLGPQRLR